MINNTLNYCRIPLGTSSDLSNLLMSLLKRNAVDRISFDDYFNHPFMNKTQLQYSQTSIEPHAFSDTFTPPKTPSPIQMKTLGKQKHLFISDSNNRNLIFSYTSI